MIAIDPGWTRKEIVQQDHTSELRSGMDQQSVKLWCGKWSAHVASVMLKQCLASKMAGRV